MVNPEEIPAFAIGLYLLLFCLLPTVEMTKGLAYRQFLLGLPAAGVVLSAVLLQESGWGVKNRFFLLIGNASFVLYLTRMPSSKSQKSALIRTDGTTSH